MKRFTLLSLALITLGISLTSCNNNLVDPAELKRRTSVIGSWELVDIVTKSPQIGDATIVVYIDFNEDSSFALSQQIGAGRLVRYHGTYVVQNGILSGTYSDGSSFGVKYKVERKDNILNLTAQNSVQDTYVYRHR